MSALRDDLFCSQRALAALQERSTHSQGALSALQSWTAHSERALRAPQEWMIRAQRGIAALQEWKACPQRAACALRERAAWTSMRRVWRRRRFIVIARQIAVNWSRFSVNAGRFTVNREERARREGVSLQEYILYSLTQVMTAPDLVEQKVAFDRLLTRYPSDQAEAALQDLLSAPVARSRQSSLRSCPSSKSPSEEEVCRCGRAPSRGQPRVLREDAASYPRSTAHSTASRARRPFPALSGLQVAQPLQAHHGQSQVRLRRQSSQRLSDP